MRLIDADKLYDWVRRECNPYGNPTIDFESGNRMLDMIKRSQIAFDKEKVIEELKEMATHSASCKNQCEFGSTEYFDYMGAEVAYKTTIEIVEKGGIE